jgi:hypothetical protein
MMYSNPMLAGNVVALLTPLVFSPLLSFVFKTPQYDWQTMHEIRKGDDSDLAAAAHMDPESIPGSEHAVSPAQRQAAEEEEQRKLSRAAKIARTLTIVLTLALLVLWPMPLYGSGYVFSKSFFTGWVTVGIIWLFGTALAVGVYPVWEGRRTSVRTIKAIFKDLTGGQGRVTHGRATVLDTEGEKPGVMNDKKGSITPPEVEVAVSR